jgi:hypothetical protein
VTPRVGENEIQRQVDRWEKKVSEYQSSMSPDTGTDISCICDTACQYTPALTGLYSSMHLRSIAERQTCAFKGITLSTKTYTLHEREGEGVEEGE